MNKRLFISTSISLCTLFLFVRPIFAQDFVDYNNIQTLEMLQMQQERGVQEQNDENRHVVSENIEEDLYNEDEQNLISDEEAMIEYEENTRTPNYGESSYDRTDLEIKRGIDVSYCQGDIDWNKVKDSFVDFAFIRVGSFNSGIDKCFYQNMNGALDVGIPVGVYIYSYATSATMAKNEAKFVLKMIEDYDVTYPVVFDVENDAQRNMSKSELNSLIDAFCYEIENAGYIPYVYASKSWFESKIGDIRWGKWVAHYTDITNYKCPYVFWQNTSNGKIDGINGRVDLNVQFGDFNNF